MQRVLLTVSLPIANAIYVPDAFIPAFTLHDLATYAGPFLSVNMHALRMQVSILLLILIRRQFASAAYSRQIFSVSDLSIVSQKSLLM